jgi:hypothetical protein
LNLLELYRFAGECMLVTIGPKVETRCKPICKRLEK